MRGCIPFVSIPCCGSVSVQSCPNSPAWVIMGLCRRMEGTELASGIPTHLLIYLNKDAFLDTGGVTANMVHRAMDAKLPLVLCHEQDAALGGCPFSLLFEQAPDELLRRRLFDTLAVQLHTPPFLRVVSLRLMLRSMGANKVHSKLLICDLHALTNQLTACCRNALQRGLAAGSKDPTAINPKKGQLSACLRPLVRFQ